MIDITDRRLYRAALQSLQAFRQERGRGYKGRFTQMFIGLKFYQDDIPSMYSNQFVSTEVLQTMLDDLYAKSSRPANDGVLVLFEAAYHARTGLVGQTNTGAQNTWRNNFNLQKGIGCYAPAQDLSSQTFLDQHRVNCRHLAPVVPGVLSGATCSLCTTGARYRNESHRKWLRIDPNGAGYALVDIFNIANFSPYVAPDGNRIPALPMAIALYHDADPSLRIGNRREIELSDFATDFNFGSDEFLAYFDDSPLNSYNAALLRRYPTSRYQPLSSGVPPAARPRTAARRLRAALATAPVLSGTPTAPPAVNTGWDAEQFVISALRQNGWTVYDVSRQHLGYDIVAKRGTSTLYVEVKSSSGYCTPTLTSREWQQARRCGERFVLAVLEHFDPSGLNTVYFVRDPANRCSASEVQTTTHSISRRSWTAAAVPAARL
jgi:Holliday junction resolvase-like predicted endonuclease